MDVFALLFILSFIALVVTLVVMSIRKSINKGKERTPLSKKISISKEQFSQIGLDQLNNYSCSWDLAESMMKREVNETQEKWKKSLPHPSTRLKNRNKRKGKKK
jgi:hypothetical protein